MSDTPKKPLSITATHQIVRRAADPTRGALLVTILLNGEPSQAVQIMSGPVVDIEAYVAGEIDADEVSRRWSFR